jgi:NADH pyrophosphatase NudC (nudix superfamily)
MLQHPYVVVAPAETVHVDGEEVIEARWFSRDELTEHAAAGGRLGREDLRCWPGHR